MIADVTSLNMIDFIALSLIAFSIFIGVVRGFVHDFFGTTAVIAALVLTIYGEPYYGPYVQQWVGDTPLATIGSGFSIFLISSTILAFIGEKLGDMVQSTAIGTLDRSLGLAFGIARGVLVVSFLYLIVGIITPNLPQNMLKARFAPWYLEGAHILSEWIPEGTFGLKQDIPIANFKPSEIYETIESLDQAVEDMSTLKPVTPEKKNEKTAW